MLSGYLFNIYNDSIRNTKPMDLTEFVSQSISLYPSFHTPTGGFWGQPSDSLVWRLGEEDSNGCGLE